jgi:hypothetical protein
LALHTSTCSISAGDQHRATPSRATVDDPVVPGGISAAHSAVVVVAFVIVVVLLLRVPPAATRFRSRAANAAKRRGERGVRSALARACGLVKLRDLSKREASRQKHPKGG